MMQHVNIPESGGSTVDERLAGAMARALSSERADTSDDPFLASLRDWEPAEHTASAPLSTSASPEPAPTMVEALLGIVTDAVIITDTDDRITSTSASVASALGYEAEALVGVHIGELIHPSDVHALATAYDAAVPVRVRRSDGSWTWHELRVQSMRAGGDVVVLSTPSFTSAKGRSNGDRRRQLDPR